MTELDLEELEKRVGTVVQGKWTLERLIGAGGMAAVYAAKHEIGRREAIKILHPDVASDKELVARFKREAHAVNRFSHPGAVEIRDIDITDDGEPFLVMELLEGESLARKLKKGPVALDEGLGWIDELLDVLVAAHAEGVIHRDIKPSNLFIEPDGRLKVLDFGVARLKHAPGTLITDAGTTLGTVAYMPPEQLRGDAIDLRADIYAVGATLFRMVSGEKVHLGEEDEVARKILKGPARTLVDVTPDVSRGVQQIVDRALAHVVGRRYPDAETMQKDVRAVQAGDPPPYATELLATGDDPRSREAVPDESAGSEAQEVEGEGDAAEGDTEKSAGAERDSEATELDEDGLTEKVEAPKVAKTLIDDDDTTQKREPEVDLDAPTRLRKDDDARGKPGKTEIADEDDLPTRPRRRAEKTAAERRGIADDAPRSLSHLESESEGGKGLVWVALVILVAVVAVYALRDREEETVPPPVNLDGSLPKGDRAKRAPAPSAAPPASASAPPPATSTSAEPSPSTDPSSAPTAPAPGGSAKPGQPSPPPLLPSGLPTALPSALPKTWPTSLPSSLPWPPQLPSALQPKTPPPPPPPPPAPPPAPKGDEPYPE